MAKSTTIHHTDVVIRSLYPLYGTMLADVMKYDTLNGDETGWPINKAQWWMWVFVVLGMTVFHVDRSRGGDMLAMLFEGYKGHVRYNSHAAWNRIGGTHQKCLYHYIRELYRTKHFEDPNPEFDRFFRTLRGILMEYFHEKKGLNPNDTILQRNRKIRNLQARVRDIISKKYTDKDCKRFVKVTVSLFEALPLGRQPIPSPRIKVCRDHTPKHRFK